MAEDKQEEGEGAQMSLIGHLTELRNRLSVAFLAFVVLFVITIMPLPGGGFNSSLSSQVFMFLQAPLAAKVRLSFASLDKISFILGGQVCFFAG